MKFIAPPMEQWERDYESRKVRRFVAYIWHTSWSHLSFGLHADVRGPNIEIHIPFFFIRLGWVRRAPGKAMNADQLSWRGWGIGTDV